MNLDQAIDQLSGAAEPSRLRLLVTLLAGETTVGDLVAVLEQSQPRVSRHLRLLAEAGLVESFREGRSVFYRWTALGLAAGVASPVAALAAGDDPVIVADRARQLKLARQRERDALRRVLRTGNRRGLVDVDLDKLPGALLPDTQADVLVIGCGAGELLQSFLPHVRFVAGTESSPAFRQLARARLHHCAQPHWTIRDDQAARRTFVAGSFDLVVLEASPSATTAQAGLMDEGLRVLRPTGQMLIHGPMLPTDQTLDQMLAGLGLAITHRQWLPGPSPDRALFLANRAVAITGDEPNARTGTND